MLLRELWLSLTFLHLLRISPLNSFSGLTSERGRSVVICRIVIDSVITVEHDTSGQNRYFRIRPVYVLLLTPQEPSLEPRYEYAQCSLDHGFPEIHGRISPVMRELLVSVNGIQFSVLITPYLGENVTGANIGVNRRHGASLVEGIAFRLQ